jgi:hypothetical protein
VIDGFGFGTLGAYGSSASDPQVADLMGTFAGGADAGKPRMPIAASRAYSVSAKVIGQSLPGAREPCGRARAGGERRHAPWRSHLRQPLRPNGFADGREFNRKGREGDGIENLAGP